MQKKEKSIKWLERKGAKQGCRLEERIIGVGGGGGEPSLNRESTFMASAKPSKP